LHPWNLECLQGHAQSFWLVPWLCCVWITKIILEQMAMTAMFATSDPCHCVACEKRLMSCVCHSCGHRALARADKAHVVLWAHCSYVWSGPPARNCVLDLWIYNLAKVLFCTATCASRFILVGSLVLIWKGQSHEPTTLPYYGLMDMVCSVESRLGIPLSYVPPTSWQPHYWRRKQG
jgi:hypothetical protein